ncbi:MAG TPA: RES family NAD+ phosphorylase [Thermoanaerobaculia bacterium]|nr:RES family NAD+ phosphorylase [Thermoanaerobaculia bacterium]
MVWERGKSILRCHDVRFGASEFNPGVGRGRFHPLRDLDGRPVPTLYAADNPEGAFSETIFHEMPVRGPEKILRRLSLVPTVLSTLAATRDLTLAQLHGYGLSRIGVTRSELIEVGSEHYGETAAWARALHACDGRDGRIDGLVWVSRQHDDAYALVLFGDRVARRDLVVVEPPLPLYQGPGYLAVQSAAERAGITIIE